MRDAGSCLIGFLLIAAALPAQSRPAADTVRRAARTDTARAAARKDYSAPLGAPYTAYDVTAP
jgi:hypothetical protein